MSDQPDYAQRPLVEGVGTDGVAYHFRAFDLTLTTGNALWDRYVAHDVFSDDGPQDREQFWATIVRQRPLLFELVTTESREQVAIITLDHIYTSWETGAPISMRFHAATWDAKAAPRRELTKQFIAWLFLQFGLHRMDAEVPATHGGACRNLERLGFTAEGEMRKAVRYSGKWINQRKFGILREEVLDGTRT